MDSGTEGSPIKFTGGYNTSTGSRDGDTWLDGISPNTYAGLYISSRSYLEFDHINQVRMSQFGIIGCSNITVKNFASTGCQYAIYPQTTLNKSVVFEKVWYLANGAYGMFISTGGLTITECLYSCNHSSGGIYYYAANCGATSISCSEVSNNSSRGMYLLGGENYVVIGNASYNGNSGNIQTGTTCQEANIFITGNLLS